MTTQIPPAATQFDGNLVTGLGGPTGFGEIVVPRGDDNYLRVDVSAVLENPIIVDGNPVNLGTLFVSTNGKVTTYAPLASNRVMLEGFSVFASDVDTRSSASGEIYVDIDEALDTVREQLHSEDDQEHRHHRGIAAEQPALQRREERVRSVAGDEVVAHRSDHCQGGEQYEDGEGDPLAGWLEPALQDYHDARGVESEVLGVKARQKRGQPERLDR